MLYAKVEIKFFIIHHVKKIRINLIYLVYYSGSDNFKQLVVRGFLLIFMM